MTAVQFEHAQLSLAGDRQENQDQVEVIVHRQCALIIAADGMGGHSGGAKASAVTIETLEQCFRQAGQPVFDPQGFLTMALARAHEQVVRIGDGIAMEQRPRATCAVCLIQDGNVYAAHVGDSRVYQLREGEVAHRSRDHSHVELLLREGLIAESEIRNHPMRNFVECCLGGDPPLPDMSVAGRVKLRRGDVVLVCTDGFWSGVEDPELGVLAREGRLETALAELSSTAVTRNAPHSDNTSAAAVRWVD